MNVRPEIANDHQAIFDLTATAFAPMDFSDDTEPTIINELRRVGDLLLSLVAVTAGEDSELVGQVTFSRVTLPCAGRWAALGPISVHPKHQRRGIGSLLTATGLDQLEADGFDGVVLIGNPLVYGPMGFAGHGNISYRGLPDEVVQWRSLTGAEPAGEIVFASAFG